MKESVYKSYDELPLFLGSVKDFSQKGLQPLV